MRSPPDRPRLRLIALVAAALLGAPAPGAGIVRDTRTLLVDGARETWRLVWDGKPQSVCGPQQVDMAITCHCSGWAYGEYGRLALVRSRDGKTIERMDLRALFGHFDYPDAAKVEGTAYLQRWPVHASDVDRMLRADPRLEADIRRRAAPVVMQLRDYDRDGAATEFLVQVGTMPCGKRQFAALGVTRGNRHLHALATAAHPDRPLTLPRHGRHCWHVQGPARSSPGRAAMMAANCAAS